LDDTVVRRSELKAALAAVWRPAAILCAVLALAAALVGVTRTGLFRVREVEVQGGGHLSQAQVLRLASIAETSNAVWLDEGEVEARLEQNVWIADASVTVTLPWTVVVEVVERSPVAVLPGDLGPTLVGDDGSLLGPAPHPRRLPTIDVPPARLHLGSHAGVEGAARVLAALSEEVRGLLRRVEVGSDASLELVLRDGLRIAYGAPEAVDRKASAIAQVLRWAEDSRETVRALNVVAPGAPAVTLD